VLVALYELGLPFRSALVEGEEGRRELAALWPMASIPVLQDETAGVVLPESSTIVEYLDGLADPHGVLIPNGDEAVRARLWDRIVDGYVAVPMQRIVADSLRDEGDRDPAGVTQARETLDRAYALLDGHLADGRWVAGADFSLADCAAAPALFYGRVVHGWDEMGLENLTRYYSALMHRPSVNRVIDEARPYRHLFPLEWPADVDAHRPEG
jgi:glutathione S-transferase